MVNRLILLGAVITMVGIAYSWDMTYYDITSSNDLGSNGRCSLVVEQNVIEKVQVSACGGFEATITLNNEFRAKCSDRSNKCTSVEESYVPNNPASYQRSCVPIPKAGTVSGTYEYVVVNHNNVLVTDKNGCQDYVDISYVNATDCACLE